METLKLLFSLSLCVLASVAAQSHDATQYGHKRSHDGPPYGLADDFESGSILSTQEGGIWKPCGSTYQRWVCGHITATDAVARGGKYSANITIQPGDTYQDDGVDNPTERDELDSGIWVQEGLDVWYGWSFMLPADFVSTSDRYVMTQWKQNGKVTSNQSPVLGLRYMSGDWFLTIRLEEWAEKGEQIVYTLPALKLGKWTDMIVNVNFSPDPRVGHMYAYVNGYLSAIHVGRTAYANPAGSSSFYNKLGIYRDAYNTSWTMFLDNYKIGQSYDEVDPSTY